MSTAHSSDTSSLGSSFPPPVCAVGRYRVLHQIAMVRRREGLSRRAVARRLGTDVKHVRSEEGEDVDMPLSRLYQWQAALGVPVAELLVDGDGSLSPPVLKRAQILRLMKTAAAIRERAQSAPIQRMAQMLVEQILEIMPEVKEVGAWNAVGQRRTLDELGEAANRRISLDALADLMD
jgi:transcriptional regulator with XRE-family HTH domain